LGQTKHSGPTPEERTLLEEIADGKCLTFRTPIPETQNDLCYGKWVQGKAPASTVRAEFVEGLLLGRFQNAKSIRYVVIDGAKFHGAITVRNADIPMEVRLTTATFDDNLDLSTSHLRGPLYLTGSHFIGPASRGPQLNFNSMEVQGGLVLDEVEVTGVAQFFHLQVSGDVAIRNAHFTYQNTSTDDDTVQFGESDIRGDMFIENSVFDGSFSLNQSNLKGLKFDHVAIAKKLDLGHAHIEKVFGLNLATDSSHPQHIVLNGLFYGDLAGVDANLSALIDRASNEVYDAQSYVQLENYYRLHGRPDEADRAFIKSKSLERNKLSWSGWLINWFLFLSVGYGRRPQNALYISMVVVLLGMIIFRKSSDMQMQDAKSSPRIYNPFWYSLDLLTPFIDLDAAKTWMPREDWSFGRNYARVQRILGWILVPIGLAAITGILK
jgi:hypothetical protein